MTVLLTITYILCAVAAGVYLFLKWIYSYWNRKGVEYIEPDWLYGNIKEMIHRKISIGGLLKKYYDDFKSRGVKCGGGYTFFSPFLIAVDLDLIKSIMLKDFKHFMNRGMYYNDEVDPLSAHLVALEDERWKNLRAKLTPTFSSGQLKMMFPTLVACSFGLEDILTEHSIIQDAVDIKDVASRFTTDAIGSVAFGIECNSLKNPDSEFRQWGKQMFSGGIKGMINAFAIFVLPSSFLHLIRFKLTTKSTEDFLVNIVKQTIDYRETNNVYRKDFMHLLLQLKNRGKVTDDENVINKGEINKASDSLTFNEIAAECLVFFVAGYETTATNITFALLELALNQDIQDKLREEINTILKDHDMQFTYDALMEMTYLNKVVDETLRKHADGTTLTRVCKIPYAIPGTNVVIEKGTTVFIPVSGIHQDPEYYPEPDKFDPERFNREKKAERHPFAYMPFGEGPRSCIASRYGHLQTKIGISAIIKNFKVTLNEKTKIPITYSASSRVPAVEGGVWLNVTKIPK